MTNQILVPLDGSRLAEQALSCAMTLGRGLPAKLVLFRAVSIPSDVQEALDKAGLQATPLMERLETDANEYLEAMSHLVSSSDLNFSHVVRHGLAADAIVDYVEQMDIHLIVMASHGYTGIKRWTHGSVAERVLQSASLPVLSVRAKEGLSKGIPEACPCRRILVPLDGAEMAEQILSPVTSVAQAVGAEVFLFRVAVDQPASMFGTDWCFLPAEGEFEEEEREAQAYLERVADPLRERGIQVSSATDIGPVAESIIEYAEANHIDLIAMCTHGRTGLARWAFGGVADRVLRAGGVPILAVRAR